MESIETLEDLRRAVSALIGKCPHVWSLDEIEFAINEAIEFWRDREEERR